MIIPIKNPAPLGDKLTFWRDYRFGLSLEKLKFPVFRGGWRGGRGILWGFAHIHANPAETPSAPSTADTRARQKPETSVEKAIQRIRPNARTRQDYWPVRRLLSSGKRTMVGPWIFFDHMGPRPGVHPCGARAAVA